MFYSQVASDRRKPQFPLHVAGQKDSAEFWPDSFSAKSPPIECTPDCSFDPEDLTIVTRFLLMCLGDMEIME